MGLCFLFLVVTVPLHVPIITSMPWALPMSVSQSPRLDPTMISISCSNLIDLFRPLGAIVPKMKLNSILPSLLQEDVEKGWCKQCRINHGADGARAEGPPSRTYFYDNVSWYSSGLHCPARDMFIVTAKALPKSEVVGERRCVCAVSS